MNEAMHPQYGFLRMGDVGGVISDVWLEADDPGVDLGALVNMFGRNLLGCRYPSCAFGQMKESSRGEGSVRSLRNGRTARRASIDIVAIRRRADGGPKSREPSRRGYRPEFQMDGEEAI